MEKLKKIFTGVKWTALAVFAWIFILILNPFVTIEVGHRGIVFDKLRGGVQEEVLGEGLHFRIPFFQNVKQMPVRTQKVVFINQQNKQLAYNKMSSFGGGGIQNERANFLNSMLAASSDLQDVYVDAVVTYHVDPKFAAKVHQEVGNDYEDKKVIPRAIDAVKTYTAKYKVADILTKREEIKEKVLADLKTQLAKDHIIVEDISLTNFDFNEQFKRAIEEKQIEEQKAQKEEYILAQKEIRVQQMIKEAEAQKESKILEGEGIAEYNQLIQQEINDKVLEYKRLENAKIAIEKWDGTYPKTYFGSGENGSGAIPLINIQP